MTDYKKALQVDADEATEYYKYSLDNKTEQQKFLENILDARGMMPTNIADIACGGGGISLHLSSRYPESKFTLVDNNENAISIARHSIKNLKAVCSLGNIYSLDLDTDLFDLVVCWQTLSWLDMPEKAMHELVRICKPGGRIFASSLFNIHHDVDVYSRVIDHTRASSREDMCYVYNTYSNFSVNKWLTGLVSSSHIHEFIIPIDLENSGRGIGTSTVMLEGGKRLQMSAGMLMNWGILEIVK